MISKYLQGKILLIIDAANLESAVKDLGWWIDYLELKDLFPKEIIESSDKYIDLKKLKDFIKREDRQQKSPSFSTGG